MAKDYDDRVSPAKAAGVGLVAAAVLIGGGWGLYEFGWAVKSENTDRAAAVGRQNLAFQQAKVDEITRKMSDLSNLKAMATGGQIPDDQLSANKAQQLAVQGIICADYRQLTTSYKETLDTDLVTTLQVMCQP